MPDGRRKKLAVKIEQSTRDGCVVLTLTGRLDLGAAPGVQRALLKRLNEQPPAIVCDLSGVASIDPLCAAIFSAVRHPALGWPGTTLLLCGAVPAVVRVLSRLTAAQRLPVYDSLDEALAHARARPPHLEERLALLPTATSAAAARSFVRQLCSRWELEALTEEAELLTSELVTNAIVHASTPLELRLELSQPRLHIAVHDQDPRTLRALDAANHEEHTRGLLIVDRTARDWGVRPDPAGGKVVWCTLELPGNRPAARGAEAPSGTGRR